jgi:hypothetical protein
LRQIFLTCVFVMQSAYSCDQIFTASVYMKVSFDLRFHSTEVFLLNANFGDFLIALFQVRLMQSAHKFLVGVVAENSRI